MGKVLLCAFTVVCLGCSGDLSPATSGHTVATSSAAAGTSGVSTTTGGATTTRGTTSGVTTSRATTGGTTTSRATTSGGVTGSTGAATTGGSTGSSSTIPWNSGNYYLFGINYPWITIGCDFGNGGFGHLANPAEVESDMATLGGEGVNVLRWWVWVDARYDPLFDSNGQVTGLDSDFFSDLDTQLQYVANNNIYLDLTLLDTSLLDAAQTVNGVQEGGYPGVVTDTTIQQSYLDNALKPLLQHIAASSYADHVLAYDVMNEPERLLPGGWGPSSDFVTLSQMRTYVQNSASYIHMYGGGALATVGSAETPQSFMGLGLDFYCVHYNNGPGQPGGDTPPPTYASLGLDKPCIVEEYATADVSFGLTDTTEWSAEWWLNTIYDQGYAGAIGWAWHDAAGDWTDFQPVFTAWGSAHSAVVGPQ